jgi:uncharacterized protein YbjT (DUF2867 family)
VEQKIIYGARPASKNAGDVMKVLAVGATGEFAGLVVPELKKRGATVLALIRRPEQAEEARRQGADGTIFGDLNDLESLRRATKGVDGVFHINPAFAPNEAALGVNMVRAAVSSRVRKFVFSGVMHPSIGSMINHAGKLPVEEALYASGMAFTVLQPAMFLQTLAAGWNEVVQTGSVSLPYSKQTKACYVDYRDVAEAAAIALTGNTLDYGTFELSASGSFDRIELAQRISEALGRPIRADDVPFEAWATKRNIPDGPLRDGLRRMFAHYNRHGFPGGNALVLRAILDREPRSLPGFIHELARGVEARKAS